MSPQMIIVFGLILLAMILFSLDSVRFDLVAMISNQATAAILAALAIETAAEMGVQARPFLMTITFAASLSLITPWGYQTNTLIYGPGRRWVDIVFGPIGRLRFS